MTKYKMQQFSIDAANLQRDALKLTRYSPYNDYGAYEFRDAAVMLRKASVLLDAVAGGILDIKQISIIRPQKLRSPRRLANTLPVLEIGGA